MNGNSELQKRSRNSDTYACKDDYEEFYSLQRRQCLGMIRTSSQVGSSELTVDAMSSVVRDADVIEGEVLNEEDQVEIISRREFLESDGVAGEVKIEELEEEKEPRDDPMTSKESCIIRSQNAAKRNKFLLSQIFSKLMELKQLMLGDSTLQVIHDHSQDAMQDPTAEDDIENRIIVQQNGEQDESTQSYNSEEVIWDNCPSWYNLLMESYCRPYKVSEQNKYKECAICYSDYQERDRVIVLPCTGKHVFHQSCLKNHFVISNNHTCPYCKNVISDTVLRLQALIDLREGSEFSSHTINKYIKLLNKRTRSQYHQVYIHDAGLYDQICSQVRSDYAMRLRRMNMKEIEAPTAMIIPCNYEGDHWRLYVIDLVSDKALLMDSKKFSDNTIEDDFALIKSHFLHIWFLMDYIKANKIKKLYKNMPKYKKQQLWDEAAKRVARYNQLEIVYTPMFHQRDDQTSGLYALVNMDILSKKGIYADLDYEFYQRKAYKQQMKKIISELEADKLSDEVRVVPLSKKQLKLNEEMSRRNSLIEFNDTIERPEHMSIERKRRSSFNFNKVINIRNKFVSKTPLIEDIRDL